ncbi:hypothetical protein FO440_19685 [Mucilaginibacter corticis]|uniref:SPOR domain-containing protein n=1 Tax=Mucilaginibacter corticis TaxID=2597670 RepID=A0A556MFN3_9SPHI|nr:hypothetical protein [Mucilaginibacter corticis]TSJ38728.1 hypothetical protein FO440_19685 [Mucilaginibacter corticis]
MDVGFYLSELLMQQGEVDIPGLGNFERLRMSGYYDENERAFYPPYHRAKFTAGTAGTEELSGYIALKKHISGASAEYFVEKYVANLKQEALTGEVAVGNLGWFYTDGGQLTFKPADKITDDSIFYGLEPVGIAKTNGTVVEEVPAVPAAVVAEETAVVAEVQHHPEPVIVPEPVVEPVIVSEPVVFENHYQAQPVEFYNRQEGAEYTYVAPETDERKSPLRIFLIIVVIILLLDTVILGIYRYYPDVFAKVAFWQDNTKPADTVKANTEVPVKVADTANTDSIETAEGPQSKGDTVVKAAPAVKKTEPKKAAPVVATKKEEPAAKPPVTVTKPAATTTAAAALDTSALKPSDATGTRRFEVYVLACKTMPTAMRYSMKLRKKGLDPRIVTDAPGKLIHISIGHFATQKEAMAYGIQQQENGKVSTDAYPIEIIPQKK